MKNVAEKLMVIAGVMVLLILVCPTMAIDTIMFYDDIFGYGEEGENYNDENSEVIHSQNNGSLTIGSTIGGWSKTTPDQLVRINSAVYSTYNTVAVNKESTARYGQIMVRLGKDTDTLVRLGLFGASNPSFPYQWGNSNAGIEILWNVNGMLHYGVNGAWTGGVDAYSTAQFHEVTINYDLMAQTYEVWYNTTKVVGPIAFNASIATIESIAIGGAYLVDGNDAALDYWHWKTSDSTAFTSYGTEIPVEKVLFCDKISEYPLGSYYQYANLDVVTSQNNGSLSVGSTIGGWSKASPDQLVEINSNTYSTYNTIAVNRYSTARYGQIMARLGKDVDELVRLGLFGVSNPSFPYQWGNSNAGIEILWNVNGMLHYGVNGAWTGGIDAYSTAQFHEVTINYDLTAQTYEVWYNTIKVVGPIAFNASISMAKSIAIGGAYWAAGDNTALDYWHWKTSDSTAFTSYGTEIPVAKVLFCDKIFAYPEGSYYQNANPVVVNSQNNGSLAVGSTIGGWSKTTPDRLVLINSGVYSTYNTVAVNRESTARYGQIMVRLGKDVDELVRLGLFGASNPSFPYQWGNSNAGIEILWNINGMLHYGVNGAWTGGVDAYSTTDFHIVTVNYDLTAQTYEVWYNTIKVVGPIAFNASISMAKSIAIGGAYWAAGDTTALDYWHWKTSDNTAFTSYGQPVAKSNKADVPMGWYAMHEYAGSPAVSAYSLTPLDESPSHYFDYVMLYYPFGVTGAPEGLLGYMDYAYSHGIKVVVDLHPINWDDLSWQINYVKDHPALYGYYLDDEPDVQSPPVTPEAELNRYNAVKGIDHSKPIFTSYYYALTAAYMSATDIACSETYLNSDIPGVAADVQVAHNAGKKFMVCPKAFDNPLASDFRYQTFGSIAQGADGVMPFIFEGFAPGTGTSPEGFRDTVIYPTTDILHSIEFLLIKGPKTYLTASTTLNNGVQRFVGDSNEALLIAVNHNDSSQSGVQITLSGLNATITTGTVVGESRGVTLSGNTFTDNFDARGVHIYRFQKP